MSLSNEVVAAGYQPWHCLLKSKFPLSRNLGKTTPCAGVHKLKNGYFLLTTTANQENAVGDLPIEVSSRASWRVLIV